MGAASHPGGEGWIDRHLEAVRGLMADSLARTPVRSIVENSRSLIGNGKMLRARLGLRVGAPAGVSIHTLVHAAAAVELIHAASLLHDDVIDGGYLRRGAPAFWVERGIPGAILLGDLMLFKALDLVSEIEDARLLPLLIRLTGEVCEAESQQELVLRGHPSEWETCVSIARRKTGALFAFAGYVAGGDDVVLSEALLESGYAVGTAYQLADDILDASGSSEKAGKTLGSDEARRKTTAASAAEDPTDPMDFIGRLCVSARERLAPWPTARRAWDEYMDLDLQPALDHSLAGRR
ncbi:MAG: polyprenyl synthetase family protein [Phycisphaerae bacterium]|nr:polyprenyl synthetase family protein [Phycisphaerae bacterium]